VTRPKSTKHAKNSIYCCGRDIVPTGWDDVGRLGNALSNSTPPQERSFLQGNLATQAADLQEVSDTSWTWQAFSQTTATVTFTFEALDNHGSALGQFWTPWGSPDVVPDNQFWCSGWNQAQLTTASNLWSAASVTWAVQNYQYAGANFSWPAPPTVTAPAVKRAERLLKGLLNAKQRRTWERFRFIVVPSRHTPGVVYRIPADGMIRMFRQGVPEKDLCIYPMEGLPAGDRVAAFKLMLEADETELLATANHHTIRKGVVPLAQVAALA